MIHQHRTILFFHLGIYYIAWDRIYMITYYLEYVTQTSWWGEA